MTAVEICGLTKRYKDTVAVSNLSMQIGAGEFFALLGVNGAGKTTTVKLLCGLTRPDSGDALVMGNSIKDNLNEVKKIIAVSPQETAVAPNLTVTENLRLICGIHGFSKAEAENKIREAEESLGLCEVSGKRASKLSGGYQRRLSIAMAIISEPQVLFLDEPTLGLDVLARSNLWDTICRLKGNMTIVLTTHYMEEAEALADRVGIMKAGQLVAVGTVQELNQKTHSEKLEEAFVKIVKGERL